VATFRPPAEKRSPMTSVGMVSSSVKGLLLVGRSFSVSPFNVQPSSGCSGTAVCAATVDGIVMIAQARTPHRIDERRLDRRARHRPSVGVFVINSRCRLVRRLTRGLWASAFAYEMTWSTPGARIAADIVVPADGERMWRG